LISVVLTQTSYSCYSMKKRSSKAGSMPSRKIGYVCHYVVFIAQSINFDSCDTIEMIRP
jgi:hypothetical protein